MGRIAIVGIDLAAGEGDLVRVGSHIGWSDDKQHTRLHPVGNRNEDSSLACFGLRLVVPVKIAG
ncbi:MAG: hypothetical protein NVS3B5_10690 [Sphingomicrobium sp.]